MTGSIGTLVEELTRAQEALTAPGAPYEVEEQVVLGERVRVFKHRPRSLAELVSGATTFGDRDCFVFSDGSRITFAQLPGVVASVAAGLRDRYGVAPGDRVAICGANSAGWLLTFWATAALGAVSVGMNGWWTGSEIRHALDLTDPALLAIDAKRSARTEGDPGVPTCDLDRHIDRLRHHAPGAALPEPSIDEDDPAMLLFTSGTTGRPKAAVLSHRSVVAYSMMQTFIGARGMWCAGRDRPVGPPPTRLAVFPLFHVSGLGTTVNGLMTGTTTVWPLGRFEPARVIELTKEHRIGVLSGAPTHVVRLLDHPDIATVDPQSIVSVGTGGSATTPELIRLTEQRFPHLRNTLASGYGSTETGALVSHAPNAMLTAAPDCVGPPLPTVEVRIVDDEGYDLPSGSEGDICARSPLVMHEYWQHPEANAAAFLAGRWVKTGDVGRIEDGALFIAARKRDLILRGGENVYPFEIENRLEEHPEVVEAAVVGVDHRVLGQEVKAVVVLDDGATLTAEDLRRWCAETLSSYKVPAHVEVRQAPLPRNASGKVLKPVLAEGAESHFVEE